MAIGNIPLDSLKVFSVAGRRKSFKAAASELGISPAAVSQRIRALEDRLAVRLFIRKTRKVVLTDEGQLLLDAAEQGVSILESALMSVAQHRDQRPIYVAATNTFADQLLLPSINDFQDRNSDATPVRLVVSGELLDLDAERIDIAIRQGRGMYANCESIKLADCEYVAVCPAHLQKHSSTLPLITVDWPVHMADAPKWPSWLELNPNIEFGERRSIGVSIESMAIRAALAGQGLALVDRFYVQSELRNGELVEAFPGSNALQLSYAHFLVRPNGLARPSAESLWQWLLQKFSEFR